MTFKELFTTFAAGTPIKRKPWGGYWKYDAREGAVIMYTKEGTTIDLLDTNDVLFTLAGIASDDWEIATKENCFIPIR